MNKDCKNCMYQIWAVGVGQGVFCMKQENNDKNLGFGLKHGRPILPATSEFVCEHWVKEENA